MNVGMCNVATDRSGRQVDAASSLTALDSIKLDVILSDAVVLSWSELMPELTSDLIYIEYYVEPMGSIEYMKVWAAARRGYWILICEHWMRWGIDHQSGPHFINGYKSDGFANMLDTIMQRQGILLIGAAPGRDRMIQVPPPTEADRVAASSMMEVFRERMAA